MGILLSSTTTSKWGSKKQNNLYMYVCNHIITTHTQSNGSLLTKNSIRTKMTRILSRQQRARKVAMSFWHGYFLGNNEHAKLLCHFWHGYFLGNNEHAKLLYHFDTDTFSATTSPSPTMSSPSSTMSSPLQKVACYFDIDTFSRYY